MGYLETVLGYGRNHMDVPLKLMFKKATVVSTAQNQSPSCRCEIELDDSVIMDELVKNKNEIEIELTLQDDVFIENNPDERTITVENEDDWYEAMSCTSYVSKEYGCMFSKSCCFVGIIIQASDGLCCYSEKNTNSIDMEDKIAFAKKWITELQEQNRFPKDMKLVMLDNCCS